MVLYIDTHLDDVVIALYENNEIIKIRIVEGVKENSKVIMPTIKMVLDERKPDSIIVVNGPGSFTGVRLGVTVAKTLAYTLNVPIRTVTSLEAMALSVDAPEKIVAFNDNNGYYVGFFTKQNDKYGDYEYVLTKDFKKFKEKYEVFEDLKPDYKKIIDYTLEKEPTNAHEVKPLYIKKLDVEND